MIQIEDVVVSFDVLREKFLCNLDACKGECCIEGDAGAPVELDEVEKLEEVLKKVSVKDPDIPYVTNVTAEVVKSGEAIKELLVRQVSSSVRWEQSMRAMIAQGIDTFVEIGPGKTLSGFMKKIDKNVNMYRISTWEEAETVCGELLKQ